MPKSEEVASFAFRFCFAVKAKTRGSWNNRRVKSREREREINAFWFYIHERGYCDIFPPSNGAHWNCSLRFSSCDVESGEGKSSNCRHKFEILVPLFFLLKINHIFLGFLGVCSRLIIGIKERGRIWAGEEYWSLYRPSLPIPFSSPSLFCSSSSSIM